ncbi:hypothetical protein SAMN05660330_03899 [Desulforhopalus singaporensis]|uniref:Uncharacterized protein n=1 Tax=Desulforhopalus singaporensis TaxID=91360 RepID=A0A1H0V6Y0_9BACT|nr:hypothetical protein SAMN05660330_03899 [Desulforhopalus singaporensis]
MGVMESGYALVSLHWPREELTRCQGPTENSCAEKERDCHWENAENIRQLPSNAQCPITRLQPIGLL